MITQQQVEQFNDLTKEKRELEIELKRIDGFLNRDPANQDNARAINQGKIFTKFAGTACYLPLGIFQAELTKRKNEVQSRLNEIDTELTNL